MKNNSSNSLGLCLLGAGGHTRSVIHVLQALGVKIFGIFDDTYDPSSPEVIMGYSLRGTQSDIPEEAVLFLSVGDGEERRNLHRIFNHQLPQAVFIHPSAVVSPDASIGRGSIVMPQAVVGPCAEVGENCIINTGAVIEHEAIVGAHSHVSVHASLCGRAEVGERCFLGAGSVVIDKISVSKEVTLGAGGVITSDVSLPGVYVGVPARRT